MRTLHTLFARRMQTLAFVAIAVLGLMALLLLAPNLGQGELLTLVGGSAYTMGMSFAYCPTPCAGVPAYDATCCAVPERGRVRHVALIQDCVTFTDPTNPAEWQAKIAAGQVILIPDVRGDLPAAEATTADGFGDQRQLNVSMNWTLNWSDYRTLNRDFYNAIFTANNWKVAWVTDTTVWIADQPASFAPRPVIEAGLDTLVRYEVVATWTSPTQPGVYNKPEGVFVCTNTPAYA